MDANDPNVLLMTIRDRGYRISSTRTPGPNTFELVLDLLDAFIALDGSLCSGGLLPLVWRNAKALKSVDNSNPGV